MRSVTLSEPLVKALGLVRGSRVAEARAVALARIRDKRELADDERRAAGVEQAAVELTGVVLEDPQASDLRGQP